jgi:cell filamentation protein
MDGFIFFYSGFKFADCYRDTINELHPFREGNGRTQREFLRTLALEKGLILNLNPPDNADVYESYMSGTIESDVNKLALLILELLHAQ